MRYVLMIQQLIKTYKPKKGLMQTGVEALYRCRVRGLK